MNVGGSLGLHAANGRARELDERPVSESFECFRPLGAFDFIKKREIVVKIGLKIKLTVVKNH